MVRLYISFVYCGSKGYNCLYFTEKIGLDDSGNNKVKETENEIEKLIYCFKSSYNQLFPSKNITFLINLLCNNYHGPWRYQTT